MAETEAVPAPEAVTEVQENGVKLPAKKIPRPTRPDDTETRAAIDLLQQSSERGGPRGDCRPAICWLCKASPSSCYLPLPPAVVKNKRRIEEIKEEIDGKRSGKGKGSAEQQAVKNKLAELRGQFQQLVVRAGVLQWAARRRRGRRGPGT